MNDTHKKFMEDLDSLFDEPEDFDFSEASLKMMNKSELILKCKGLLLDSSGSKKELIDKLLQHDSGIVVLDADSNVEFVDDKGVKGDRV